MASIDPITGAPTLSTPATGSKTLGKNEFLKLLTAQLANQDPLSPTDNQAFIAQLAQFASVEQAEATNSRLDSLILAQAANNQTAVANLVGKDIVYKTDKVTLGADSKATISGQLSGDASIVNAIITDANGKKIRTITQHDFKAGVVNFEWDGKDDAGNPVAAGDYKVQLTAADSSDHNVGIALRGRARATGITFENGIPELMLNGQRVKLSDVLEISEPTTPPNPALDNFLTALTRS